MPEVTFTLPSALWQGSHGPRRTPLVPRDLQGQFLPRPCLRIAGCPCAPVPTLPCPRGRSPHTPAMLSVATLPGGSLVGRPAQA